MVKVSVIIPVYNVEDYLKECLDSVLSQTLKDIEVICVDDCSTDDSLKILQEYANNDDRIKIIKNEKNSGQGFSRNEGIKKATGEYIGFVDSDDFIDLNLFEISFKKAKKLDLDVLLFKTFAFDNELKELTDFNKNYLSLNCLDNIDKLVFSHYDTKEVTCNISVAPWCKLYKNDFLVENNIRFPEDIIFEDEVFFYRVYLNAKRVSILDNYLYYYRVNRRNSTMVRKDNKFMDIVDAFRLIRQEFIKTNNYDYEYKKFLFNKFFYSIFTRFNETTDEFKNEFFLKVKSDFQSFLKTRNDLNLVYDSYKSKVLNILFSNSYMEYCSYEKKNVTQKYSMKDIDTFFRISIIIPVYNMENFLTRAIDSIINQSFGFNKLEVILVDDCSSDNSRKIIGEYCEKYDNIKSVFLKENSGFAGKPRNIGLRYASADYVMFLDPDDSYFEDACNVLYEKITNENADIVSGNFIDSFFQDGKKYDWEDKFELKGDEIKVNSIKENMNLFNVYPSVWAKIFKKDFILSNNIWFPEHLPGQDLFFVHHALFKAKGIVFINKEIVYYDARDGDDDEISVSCNNSKKVLIGLIKLYYKHLSLFEKYAPNNIDIVLKSLYYWITKFIDSNLDLNEIKEVVNLSSILFQKFLENENLQVSKDKFSLFKAISNKDYDKVVVELVKLNGNSSKLDLLIKNKNIFLLCYALEPQIGGLAKAVLTRSKKLSELGYKVTILTVDFGQNYEFVIKKLCESGYLDDKVDIVNLFDYYRNKNEVSSKNDNLIDVNLKSNYKLVHNNDESVDRNYFENGVKIKTERYFDNYLAIEKYFQNDKCIREKAFTKDGFCFYEMFIKNNREFYCLNNQKDCNSVCIGAAHEYNKQLHFQTFFVEEICRNCEEKPFLIIESTGHIPSIGNVSSDIAYKIGQLHGNIFKEPYVKGSDIQSFSAINDKDNLDSVVTLTESQKKDLIDEFGYERFTSIPNFVEPINLKNVEKNFNKISFTSSISFHKNLFDLVKAFQIVIKSKKEAKLEIFGRAYLQWEIDELNKIKSFIKENNMENNITFRGYVDNIYEEVEDSLCTVFTSHSEGFCLGILESMLCATPAIAFNFNYGPSDIISNGKDGIIVNQYDVDALAKSIIDLLDNPNKAIKMGKLARKNVLNNFVDDVVILKWEQLFKDIIDKHIEESSIKLSVVIPVYNTGEYIDKCLSSIMNQSLKEIEIICIDDCSTDNSLERLYEFAARDERIKIISLNENHGQGFARNVGIKYAKGEYLSFIDADDWIELDAFESTYSSAKKNNLDMVIFKLINYNCVSKEFYETDYYNINFLKNEKEIFNYKDLLNKLFSIPVGPVNKIYKTSILKENNISFPEVYSMFEDNPFFYEVFLLANKVSFISNPFYFRRVHDDSIMQNRNNKIFDIVPVLDEVISIFLKHNIFEEFDHILFNHKVSVIKMWYERLDNEYKYDFYKCIKENFEKNKYINNVLVEDKLTKENFDFYKSIIESDTFKEFNLIMLLKLKNIKYNVQNYLFNSNLNEQTMPLDNFNVYNNKLGQRVSSSNFNINKYEDKIRYLNYCNKMLKKELNELKLNNKGFFKQIKSKFK
ncbi:glycosyltransferase [Methanobrevibacter smithii]|uniref:glycosyltransferase n=1 Tax=Methanobrevibacter smithii TaxID=2173 RepID=UPI0003730EBE|nr:glycosyltransferase [Methanobrevibacter smithii]